MINLYVNYYKPIDKQRQEEIDFCFDKNLNNSLINQMIVFGSFNEAVADAIVYVKNDRPTYQDYFNKANEITSDDDINIICNSDIYFDETLELVKNIKPNEVYCLTRWEYNDGQITDFNKMHGAPHGFSQDAWIWRGKTRMKDCDKVIAISDETKEYDEIPFNLGIAGCDNHIAYRFGQSGYKLLNPSIEIRAIHVHKEQSRNYTIKYRITGIRGAKWGKLQRVDQTRL